MNYENYCKFYSRIIKRFYLFLFIMLILIIIHFYLTSLDMHNIVQFNLIASCCIIKFIFVSDRINYSSCVLEYNHVQHKLYDCVLTLLLKIYLYRDFIYSD